jgi:riboflavin synthase
VTAVVRVEDRLDLTIAAPYNDLSPGESVAVNGVCLTVAELGEGWFRVQAVATTRDRTRLGDLMVGDRVNLERALRLGDRLGGHMVQGHVDGLARVLSVRPRADEVIVELELPADVVAVTVPRGSLTVDGVSLTVASVTADGSVEVALIPYTREHTTLGRVRAGDRVHVEGDMIGKYVQQLMPARS